ncbi:MAG: hypothetical protein V7698_08275 [Paracoccaceae bacterium]
MLRNELRRLRAAVAGLACALAFASPAFAEDPSALENPALAMGLNGISDWSAQHPFIDMMKTARPWVGHLRGQFGGFEADALRAQGYLDENGWPRAVPPGVEALESFVLTDQPAAAKGLTGRYVLSYEGIGRVQVTGAVSNIRYRPKEIRFDFVPGNGLVGIRVDRIDPMKTGDYLRNFRLMREEHIPLDQLGLRFNPDWLRHVQDMRVLRFMDWMGTNGSGQKTWGDRPRVNDASYAAGLRGVPVEVMVDLANEVGADPWFNMPHKADDDYFRQFASYVRDHLDPTLKAYVEYSNEVWNWQFQQATWAMEQAVSRWDMEGGDGWVQIAGMRAAQMSQIWTEVFGEEADARLVRVIGTQTGWLGLEEGLLAATNWVAEDPTNRPPFEYFDAYAITGYFGVDGDPDITSRRILEWLDVGENFATQALTQELRDTSVKELLSVYFPYHADVAARHGLKLIMYEGGTHIVGFGDWTENEQLTDFYTRYNFSPEIAGIYSDLLEGWHAAGGTLFNAFVDVGWPSRWGSWGHLRHLDDSNPRWDVLMDYNKGTPVTWEERTPGTFSNGIIRRAAREGSRVEARHPRDILLGGDGDDILVATGCCTRLHGGAGRNVAVLPGVAADYVMHWQGNSLLANNEGGEIRMVNVQALRFSEGQGESVELTPGIQP